MFCKKCGEKLEESINYCTKCGFKIGSLKTPINLKNIKNKFENLKNEIFPKKSANKKFIYFILLIIILVLGIGSYFGYKYYKEKNNRINQLVSDLQNKENEKNKLNIDLENCNDQLSTTTAELIGLKEKYGLTLSEKEKAEAEASEQRSEATRQKNIAQQKESEKQEISGQLSGCQYYLNLAAQLTDILMTQRDAYEQVGNYILQSSIASGNQNYNLALYYLDLAEEGYNYAKSFNSQVDAIMYQFGY